MDILRFSAGRARRKAAPAASGDRSPCTRERGVALVLTLAVLALLLILGMSFSFQSRTSLMESEVNADLVRARLLAESALERCTAYLEYNYKGMDQTGWNSADMYPATAAPGLFFAGNGAWAGRRYAVSMAATPDNAGVETALQVDTGFPFTPSWLTQTAGNALHANTSWHHVMGPEDYTDTNGNGKWDAGEPLVDANGNGTWDPDGAIIGRIAFLVIDESGKLDPTWCVSFHEPFVDDNGNDSYDPGEVYWDLNGSSGFTSTSINEGSEVRFGGRPQEIDLEYALPAAIQPARDGWRTLLPVVNGRPTRWFSWWHIFARAFGGAAANVGYAQTCTQTIFPFSYDIEAFHSGTDPDTLKNEHHRFDLICAPWEDAGNKPTVSSIQALDAQQAFWDASTTPPSINNSLPASGGGIPWLSQMKDENGNSVANQVAANLIDYCDSDSTATSDYPNGNPAPAGGTAKPDATYVGLEKVPYINEIRISAIMQDAAATPPLNDWDLTITVDVELINIYDVNLGPVTVSCLADFTGPSGNKGKNQSGSQSISVPAHSYAVATITFPTINDNIPTPISFNLEDIAVGVYDGANMLDFTRIYRGACSSWPPDKQLNVLPAPAPPTTISNSLEVMDPRANTGGFSVDATYHPVNNPGGNWVWSAPAWTNGIGAGTILGRNNSSNPSSPGWTADTETVNDPAAGMSTAFIRNAPPLSLWELGCIHRGERWRTINLKAYGTSGKYADGDAAILDQVKLGDPPVTHGKVNANSPVQAVWEALLDHIVVGGEYDDPAGSGAGLTDPQITSLASAIVSANSPAWDARGRVADAAALHDGSVVTQTTDRMQEEIIGKIANLLTVRQNYFTVIATGQAVQDLGALPAGAVPPEDAVEYDSANNKYVRILATQKIMAVVYRDAFTNQYRIERFEYLEE